MIVLLNDFGLYLRKRRRAIKINRIKAKVPPYLKKDFGVELNYKLWITKGARFAASERTKRLDVLSTKTIGYLSAYLIIFNMLNIYEIGFYTPIPDNYLAFISTALSILILIFSQFESFKSYNIRSEKYHSCAIEIGILYNQLRMVKTFISKQANSEPETERISCEYDELLKRFENHEPIDTDIFKTTKPDYFKLSLWGIYQSKIKEYVLYFFPYHLLMYGPILLLIAYQSNII